MIRSLTLLLAAAGLTACAVPTYEAEPVSVTQWERRQQAIERELAERERLCRTTRDEDPRKAERCRGVSGDQD